MVNWATDFIDAIGLVGVALLIALESIFPPIPSELILLLAGSNVAAGRFGYVGGLVASTVGSVIGAYVLYGIGRVLSEDRLERFLATVGRVVGLKRDDVHKGFVWFERHGSMVLFFGRLVPVVRSVVSIPAGAEKMSIARFTVLTAAGSVLWNAVWVAIGWGLGNEWEKAGKWGDYLQYAVVVVVAVGLIYLVVKARRQRAHETA